MFVQCKMMSKTVLILSVVVAAVTAAPPLEKESHDEAYNSIISQYYTTDPFFAKGRRAAYMTSPSIVNFDPCPEQCYRTDNPQQLR